MMSHDLHNDLPGTSRVCWNMELRMSVIQNAEIEEIPRNRVIIVHEHAISAYQRMHERQVCLSAG